MGMYDIVLVPCPNCGKEEEFQSKSGECLLLGYKLSECPADVLRDVNRHSPYECEECGTKFAVGIEEKRILVGKPIIY